MSLVNTDTGEFVAMNEVDARELIDGLKRAVTIAENQIIQAWEGRAWLALGYESWDEMVAVEFKTHYLKIAPDERRAKAIEMAKVGMSTRAVASALGVGQSTVVRDLASGEPNESPDTEPDALADVVHAAFDVEPRITGVDGKSYPARPTPRPITAADVDEAEAAVEVVPLGHLVPPIDDRAEAQAVVEAFAESLTTDADRTNNAIKAAVNRLHAEFISNHTAESLVDVFDADDLDDLRRFADLLIERVTAIREAQPGLRLVQGGHR